MASPSTFSDSNNKYIKGNVSRSTQGTPSGFSNSNSSYIKGNVSNTTNKPSESGKGCKV